MEKYLIVGGVAGGATVAARLRRLNEKSQIILFERGDFVSFANCGLPYYIGDTIKERENLFVMTPEKLNQRLNIDVRVKNEVISIDREKKSIKVKNLISGKTYEEEYDRLILSPGAAPFKPPIPGINNEKIFTLRTVPDTDKIKEYIEKNNPQRAIVVGAGFIGLEMAENLHHLGIKTTIVEMSNQVMAPLDYEMASAIHHHMKDKNVELYLNDGVSSFEDNDNNSIDIALNSGKILSTDMVIFSIGVRPESKLAEEAGLELTEQKGIVVNQYLQTSDTHIYALGDAIAFENPITGKKTTTLLAGPANRQGRICADNIAKGNIRSYKGSINSAIAKVFDLTVATTGMAEKTLKKEGIKHISNIIHSNNHAGYYPGATQMSLKVVFSPEDGRLLGAQAVGYDGVDKRIDIIATIIGQGGTIYDLQDVEHCYAPPYSSAKDPVNIAGYAAENIIKGLVKTIDWSQLRDEIHNKETFILDVRTPMEYELGNIQGSTNIPVDELRDRLKEVPSDKKIIVYCAVGLRGYFGSRILYQNGFENLYNLSGGYKTYAKATAPQGNEGIFNSLSEEKNQTEIAAREERNPSLIIDACGLQCPGPIVRLKKESDNLASGAEIMIKSTDPGFQKDVQSWCNLTGNSLLSITNEKGITRAIIKKGEHKESASEMASKNADGKTIVVFSDDFDRAMASFVIANGAASTGKKVTLFFTFWGLNLLKKPESTKKIKKDLISKMFGFMLPKGTKDLNLSKMNMFGMGPMMMRKIMKSKNIDSLESMLKSAADFGIEMIACQMSMDVMGVKKEELFDFVKIGGVATYLEAADQSNLNLFI